LVFGQAEGEALKPSEILRPGMIGVNLKGHIDPMGTLDTLLQGDTDGAHVWWVLPNGKIATTGAKALVIYGEADPDTYLAGKSCYLLETVDPLTAEQLKIMEACHQQIMRSGLGRIYGIWKFGVIWALALFNGDVSKTGYKPKTTRPICPICSQAVGYCYWSAGIPIGKSQGKEDWTSDLPETIIKEAKQTGYSLAQGWMNNRITPCYMLKTIQDKPFQF
jgi:hypothetical protein